MTSASDSGKGGQKWPNQKAYSFGNDPVRAYLDAIGDRRTLTREEERQLFTRIATGDKLAFNELIEANLKFVVAVCRQFSNRGLAMGDLISEGNLGLMIAARRFDVRHKVRFVSYAVWWIRQRISAALSEQDHIVSRSPSTSASFRMLRKISHKLEQLLGRPPSVGELADATGKTERDIEEGLVGLSSPLSLNTPAMDGEARLEEFLEDIGGKRSDEDAIQALLQRNLNRILSDLDERQAQVIRLYYGLDLMNPYTLEEISERFGLTRERVRQIKEEALNRLRHPKRSKVLRRFLS